MRTFLIFALLAIACATVNCRALKDESESMLTRDTNNRQNNKKTKTSELKISFPLFRKDDDQFALFRRDDDQFALFKKGDGQYALFRRGQNAPPQMLNNALFKKSDDEDLKGRFLVFNKRLIQEGSNQMSDVGWFKDRATNDRGQYQPFEPFKRSKDTYASEKIVGQGIPYPFNG